MINLTHRQILITQENRNHQNQMPKANFLNESSWLVCSLFNEGFSVSEDRMINE